MVYKNRFFLGIVICFVIFFTVFTAVVINPNKVSAAPTNIAVIDTTNKNQVISLYKSYFDASQPSISPLGLDVANCSGGSVSTANIDYALTQINWFRAMAGLDSVTSTTSLNAKAQASALFTTSNQEFVAPNSSGSTCNSVNATSGVQNGNRALINNVSTSKKNVALWMDDYESSPTLGVSNRYSLLSPKAQEAGYGVITPHSNYFWGAAAYVWAENLGARTVDIASTSGAISTGGESLVAWPNKGYTPYKTTYSLWSIAGEGIDWSNADVTITKNGNVCSPPEIFKGNISSSSRVESNLVWDMDQAGACSIPLDTSSWTHAVPSSDTPYTVTIVGAKNSVGAALPNIVYTTTVISTAITPTGVDISSSSVNENSSNGAYIGTLSPQNASPTDDTWTYSLDSSVPGAVDNGLVSISGTSLRVASLINYEQPKTQLKVGVRISGTEGNSATQLLTINVNDLPEAPVDLNMNTDYYSGAYATGTFLASFFGVDEDAGSAFTYSLVSGTGDDNNSEFTISGNQLRAGSTLDYGRKFIRVRVTDNTGRTFDKSFLFGVVPTNYVPMYTFLKHTFDNGVYFMTIETEHRDRFKTYDNFTYGGTPYYVIKPNPNGSCPVGSPVYRFFRYENNTWLYISDEATKDRLATQNTDIMNFGGVAWCANLNPNPTDNVIVYRFFNKVFKYHRYIGNENIKNHLIQNESDTYNFGGPEFYALR